MLRAWHALKPEDLDDCRSILTEMAELFEKGREARYAALFRAALAGTDKDLERFVVSGYLWGGMGSIPDSVSFDDFGFDTNARRFGPNC